MIRSPSGVSGFPVWNALSALLWTACARGPARPAAPPPPDQTSVQAPSPSPPARPLLTLPLSVGDRWTYTEERREGGGLVFWVLPLPPSKRERVATRTLEVTAHDPSTDRYQLRVTHEPVNAVAQSEVFTVWNDAQGTWMLDEAGRAVPVATGNAPPEPLEGELVACDFRPLRVQGGRCAPAGDGPLHSPPGLLGVRLSTATGAQQLGTVLVGVMTGGLLFPAAKGPTVVVELESFVPADGRPIRLRPETDFLRAVAAAGAFVEPAEVETLIRRHAPSVDELAVAMVRLSRRDTAAGVLPVMLSAVDPPDRHRLLRASLQRSFDGDRLLLAVIGLEFLPETLPEPHRAALAQATGRHAEVVAQLLAKPEPFVAEWIVASGGNPHPEHLEAVLARHSPDLDGLLLAMGLLRHDSQRVAALRAFLPALPPSDRAASLLALSHSMGFDTGTLDAMALGLPALPDTERLGAFITWYGRLQFDDSRLAAVSAQAELVGRASLEQRAAMYAEARFPDEALARALGISPP